MYKGAITLQKPPQAVIAFTLVKKKFTSRRKIVVNVAIRLYVIQTIIIQRVLYDT